MTDVVVDELRIRGPAGRRLAAVAARALPSALAAALGDLDDVDLGTLHVSLAPEGYDDATLAVLWADQVRRAALAAGARPRSRDGRARPRRDGVTRGGDVGRRAGTEPSPPTTGPDSEIPAPVPDVASLVALLAAWVGAEQPLGRIPVAVRLLADADLAAEVIARLDEPSAERLRRVLSTDGPAPGRAVPPGEPPATEPGPWSPEGTRPASRTLGRAPAPRGPDGSPPATVLAARAAALRPVLALAEAAGGTAVDLRLTTRAGGLVLLHPWLATLCRQVETWHPDREAVAVRRLALAALADPDDPTLLDDPLVLLLAGVAPTEVTTPHAAPDPLDPEVPVEAAVERVLAGLAALLPGFERSSPGFVRDAWVRRPGLLDVGSDPVALVAATSPLDVVLVALPYPLGLLRLPWSQTLSVRFTP